MTPQTEIVVRKVEHYGRLTFYPESEQARKFAELLGQKTLTRENIEKIKSLGFKVVTKSESEEL